MANWGREMFLGAAAAVLHTDAADVSALSADVLSRVTIN